MSHTDLREIDLQSNPFLLALQGASAGAAVSGKGGGSKAAAAAAALSAALAALYEQVAARGGLVLLPPPSHCPKQIDERWATRHILLPADGQTADGDRSRAVSTVTGSPSGGEVELAAPAASRWMHPDGSAAHIASGVVYEGEAGCADSSSRGGGCARVLLEELHYDDEFRSFKVLCLDRAMWPPPGGRAGVGHTGPPARKGSVSAGDRSNGLHHHAHSAGAPVPPASASSSLQQQLRRPRDRPEFRSLCEHRDVLTSVLGEGVATHAIFASPRLDFFFTDFSLAWLGVVARDENRAAEHIRAACARTLAEAITCIKQGSVANPLTPSSGSVASSAGGGAGGAGHSGPATAKSLAQWSPGRYAELEIAIQAHVHSCLHSKIFSATLAKLPAHRAAADRLSKALSALADVGGVSLFDVGLSPHLVGLVDPRAAVEHMRSLHTFVTPLERMACLARVEAALMDSISATSATNKNQAMARAVGSANAVAANGHGGTSGSATAALPLLSRNATLPAGGLSAQVSSLLHASPSAAAAATGAGAGATIAPPTGTSVGVRSGASSFHRPRSLTQCNLFEDSAESPFAGPFAQQQQSVAAIPSSSVSPSSHATSAAINIAGAAPGAPNTDGGVVAIGSSSPQRSRLNLPPLSSSPGPPLPPKQRGKHSPGGGVGTPSSSPPSQLSSIPPPLSLQPQAHLPQESDSNSTVAATAAAVDPAPAVARRRKSSAPAPLSVSADDLLPLLVFVVVEARPPAVHANIAYMRAYSPGPALLTPSVHSELHYRLANFEAAVSYVESGRLLQHVRESQAARDQASHAASASASGAGNASGPKRRARPRMSSISIQSTRTLHLLLTPQSSSSSRRNLFNGDAAAPSGVGSGAGTANSSVANSRRASTDGSSSLFAEALATNSDASAAAGLASGVAGAVADGEEEEEEEHSMFDADVEGLDEEDEDDACIDPRLLGGAFARFGAGADAGAGAADADGVCSDGDMPDLFARASAGRALRRSSRSAEPLFHQARRAASGGEGSAATAGSGNAAAAAASLFGCSIPEPDSLLGNGSSLPAWLTGASTDTDGATAGHESPSRSRSPVVAPLVVAAGDSRIPAGRTRSDTVVRAPMAPFLPRALSSNAIVASASAASAAAAAATTSSSTSPPSVHCSGSPSPPSALSPSLGPLPSHPSWSSSVLSSPLVPLREALDEDDLDPLGALTRTKKSNKAN